MIAKITSSKVPDTESSELENAEESLLQTMELSALSRAKVEIVRYDHRLKFLTKSLCVSFRRLSDENASTISSAESPPRYVSFPWSLITFGRQMTQSPMVELKK